jgi:histone H3/H4
MGNPLYRHYKSELFAYDRFLRYVKKLIKKRRIEMDATDAAEKILENVLQTLLKEAGDIADHSGRNMIHGKDIDYAARKLGYV